jgi:hypothetical protein
MSTLVQACREQPAPSEEIRTASQASAASCATIARLSPFYREQIQSLVQQLLFNESKPVRYVGITGIEDSTEIAQLSFDVAHVLAEESRYDVGLIDASPASAPLETQLELASPGTLDSTWPIAPHLWFVPRENWMHAGATITEQSTVRLRELAAEFDFSILHCPSVSWLTASIARACDGLVLVLTAHKTRRLVAIHVKDQLHRARVPLLGTVLRERRLPIPEALYHDL